MIREVSFQGEGRASAEALGFGRWRNRKANNVDEQREREMHEAGLGAGRARSRRSAGPREGNFDIILKVIGQQAFSTQGPTVNTPGLAGRRLSVATTQRLSSALVAQAVFE